MTDLKLRFAATSDVGRVRRDNQDSGYAGSHLLVVADGVGGSVRGDVASSACVDELRRLDTPLGNDALEALAGAIHRSHDRLREIVADHPELDGTSTTVSAGIFNGTHLGVVHVGDSRGYLLRDGELQPLTTDHTLVQNLIEEGRITEEEARVHPHRNLILRAVDAVHEPEPDVLNIELQEGDRLLFCSDGCSGVLEDELMAALLGKGELDTAGARLVSAALDAGSTDNVTVVLGEIVADGESAAGPLVVGAAATAPHQTLLRDHTGNLDSGEITALRDEVGSDEDLDPEALRYAPRAPRRFVWGRRILAALLVLGLIGFGLKYLYDVSQDQYYVSETGDRVAIYQGVQADLPGMELHSVFQETDIELTALPSTFQRQVRAGISADSLPDARRIISDLRGLAVCDDPAPTPSPTASATKSPTKRPTGTRAPSRTASPKPSGTAAPKPGATQTPKPTASSSPDSTATVDCGEDE